MFAVREYAVGESISGRCRKVARVYFGKNGFAY